MILIRVLIAIALTALGVLDATTGTSPGWLSFVAAVNLIVLLMNSIVVDHEVKVGFRKVQ